MLVVASEIKKGLNCRHDAQTESQSQSEDLALAVMNEKIVFGPALCKPAGGSGNPVQPMASGVRAMLLIFLSCSRLRAAVG